MSHTFEAHFDEGSFRHQAATHALMGAAPVEAKASLGDAIARARALNIPWMKIMMAIATAAAGGFSPAAIAAAIAMLFGSTP